MPTPVPIPAGALVINDTIRLRAEALVASFAQAMRSGTSGATSNAPPSRVPVPNSPDGYTTVELASELEQLFYLHLMTSVAQAIEEVGAGGGGTVATASQTVLGITKISSAAANPANPVSLNSEEVTSVPAAGKVVRAEKALSTINEGWIPATIARNTYVDAGDAATLAAADTAADAGDVVTLNAAEAYTDAAIAAIPPIVGGAGLLKTGATLDIELNSAGGLEFDAVGEAGKLKVKLSANPSLALSASGLAVQPKADGALQNTATGIAVQLQAVNPTLAIVSNELGVKHADLSSGLTKDATGIKIALDGASSGLQLLATGLSVKVRSGSSGLATDAGGIFVKLEADKPSLYYTATDELALKMDPNGGLVKDVNGVLVQLAASSGLKVDSTGLRVMLGADPGLQLTAAGLVALLNGATLQKGALGISVKGLPSLFEVNGVAVSANITAANLNTLTGGGNADALHAHAGVVPGGATSQLQYNDAGAFGGMSRLESDASGVPLLVVGAKPSTPAANRVALYARKLAKRPLSWTLGEDGLGVALQPAIFDSMVRSWMPGGTATIGVAGGMTITSANTYSQVTPTSGSLLSSSQRGTFTSATAANSVCGFYGTPRFAWRGNAVGLGGFFFHTRFAPTTNTAANRGFFGLGNPVPIGGAEPSVALYTIGVGWDSTDANTGNLWLMSNDGAGAATRVDTGAPRSTATVWDLWIWCKPNDTAIYVRLVNAATGTVYLDDLAVTTDLPNNTVFLAPNIHLGAAATAVAQTLDVMRMYLETPN